MLKRLSYIGLFMILVILVGFSLWQKQVRKNALPTKASFKEPPGSVIPTAGKKEDSLYFLKKDSSR